MSGPLANPPAAKSLSPQPGVVKVLLPSPFDKAFDYLIDIDKTGPSMAGAYVEVPFGKQTLIGVVWQIDAVSDVPFNKLKVITGFLPLPPMQESLRHFLTWVADYTMSPLGLVLKMALAGGKGRLQQEKTQRVRKSSSPDILPGAPIKPILSQPQIDAAAILYETVTAHKFAPVVLDGVTGSGKTEVYCEAIAKALEQDKQVLVLLPEIALTTQLKERFTKRFGFFPTEWHSEMTPARRYKAWQSIVMGNSKLILGARSALFLPYPKLGLIIVDEEHEIFYKQEEGVIYQGRDMAIMRAKEEDCPVILSSATPSLETIANIENGRYRRVCLPERHADAQLPFMELIDIRKNRPERQRWLAPALVEAITANLEAKEQSLLFLNRRGYAPLTLCRACGFRWQCPSCSAWLVSHQTQTGTRLLCHHCDYKRMMPQHCPKCQAQDQFASCGPGVERLEEEAKLRWPTARIAILASDIVGGTAAIQETIERMERREIDILIGTAIVAKGHNFPWLTIVGVIDADLGLQGGDLRAAERTYQLLHQVAGRSGRHTRPGRVFLQTAVPDHPTIQALIKGDRDGFIAEQFAERDLFHMPPFGRLASLILSSANAASLDRFARDLGLAAPKAEGIKILGPSVAQLALLRGRHRRRFLIKGNKVRRLQPFIANWLAAVKLPADVKIQIDIDPYNFL